MQWKYFPSRRICDIEIDNYHSRFNAEGRMIIRIDQSITPGVVDLKLIDYKIKETFLTVEAAKAWADANYERIKTEFEEQAKNKVEVAVTDTTAQIVAELVKLNETMKDLVENFHSVGSADRQ